MTNDIKISRELAERLANVLYMYDAENTGAATELDALIAAPVVERQEVLCSHEWTDDGEFTLVCTKCGAQENHEPYGWVQTRGEAINEFTQEWDVVQAWGDRGFEYKSMFDQTSPPAPVSVVLPTFEGYQQHIVRELQAAFSQACEMAGVTVVKELNQ